MQWHDWVGLSGVAIVLVAFFLLQSSRLHGTGLVYQLMNAIGAAAVVLSLCFNFNLSAFVVETAWVAISAFGIWRGYKTRQIK